MALKLQDAPGGPGAGIHTMGATPKPDPESLKEKRAAKREKQQAR